MQEEDLHYKGIIFNFHKMLFQLTQQVAEEKH